MEEVQIIRCKAWDETHKEWVTYGFCLRFDVDGNSEILNAFGQPFTDERKLVLVPWAGVQDDHGKDIYKGDIVRSTVNYTDEHRGVIKFGEYDIFYSDEYGQQSSEAHGFFVHWLKPESKVKLDDGSLRNPMVDNTASLNPPTLMEVIGNVYEHPDLLQA